MLRLLAASTRCRMPLCKLDADLLEAEASPAFTSSSGVRRVAAEFLWFGIKQARAWLFARLFFAAVFVVPRSGLLGISRYDLLLLIALAIQAFMVASQLETWDELKAITLFHLIGFCLVPGSAGRLDASTREQVELVVVTRDHDVHHRRKPQARERTYSRDRVAAFCAYADRIASTGSMRDARHAGMYAAAAVTSSRMAVAIATVAGSRGDMP